jgi:hypothetical protein
MSFEMYNSCGSGKIRESKSSYSGYDFCATKSACETENACELGSLAGGDFEAIMSVKTNWNKAVGGADK